MVQNCYGSGMHDRAVLQGGFGSPIEKHSILTGRIRLSWKGFLLHFTRHPHTQIHFADVDDADTVEYVVMFCTFR
ncbi:Uncharacterised protein [Mycobacteroides abscessus subsp. abscessus]|nr:Uncharacterised protein [Mycobacteroides abscessus subsp. abscessus]SHZ09666.1 Uncharacterised protein [Mycobacteroides abscessus subsp. abscessus]